ncbi:MAG: carboxylating nicotinate-nucleotide diphosphorylase [Planctomycetota bacterium]
MPMDPNAMPLPDLFDHLCATGLVERLLTIARDEDLGPSGVDLTAKAVDHPEEPEAELFEARVVAREPCRLAGVAAVPLLLDVFRAELAVDVLAQDGTACRAGDGVLAVRGPRESCVRVERTLLNLLGRLSGVATQTAGYVQEAGGRCHVLDTRKTTPGLRVLEKYAVRCGGGRMHRLGLHDAVLIKDNHLAGVAVDALPGLLAEIRERAVGADFVEVEVDTIEQFAAVLRAPSGTVDIVLLDNMPLGDIALAVNMRRQAGSALLLEASGGINLETVGAIARSGVDRVSIGALTHSAVSVDFGLDVSQPANNGLSEQGGNGTSEAAGDP